MIDLAKLEAFIYAAEHLSFSEAARHLQLAQPTISHRIKTLEQELNVALFVRSGHTLSLTEAGRVLLPWAHKLIHQALETEEMMASLQDEVVGSLRVACSTTAGKYVLTQLAARFCQRYPGIQVSILACTAHHVIPRMLEGEANLAVVSSYDLCGYGFECQEFFTDHINLIIPADHPWVGRQSVEPADLLSETLLMRELTSGTRRVLLTELAKHDIALGDLDVALEVGNAEAIVRTVEAGYGIAFVSALSAAWAVAQGSVVQMAVQDMVLERKVFMIRRSLMTPYRPQETFWGFVHDPGNADLLEMASRAFV
ncbi:MAG: hypothetical protein CSA11_05805 [Chloroflexi bacterium]|nr:MAG: hypothetical protein CSA11_05805 [Chloroflexota bacterium]